VRRFTAPAGPHDVVVGHESWGTFVLLFTPARGGDTRKSVLAAETALAAETELDAMSDDELRARLAESSPW
jgi:hypothetical protein